MKNLFFAVTLVTLMTSSHSQSGAMAGDLPIELERARLQESRSRETSAYDKARAACYTEFAVTDCLAEVRRRHHERLADLRRQEISLNDAERKRKGIDQLQRIEEKSSPKAMQDEADKRSEALKAQKERQERADRKAAERLDATSSQANPPKKSQEAAGARASKAAAADENQKKYNDKLRKAQERKASRDKNRAEKSPSTAKPLPDPP